MSSSKNLLILFILWVVSAKSYADFLSDYFRQRRFLDNDNVYDNEYYDSIVRATLTDGEDSFADGGKDNIDICSLKPEEAQMVCRCIDSDTWVQCVLFSTIPENSLVWDAFAELSAIDRLHFTSRPFGVSWSLPSHIFKFLPGLKTITIRNIHLSIIDEEAFSYLNQVTDIKLDDNHIEELHRKSFSHLPNLDELSLSENYLTKINIRTFVALPKLRVLFLDRNNISIIEDSAFAELNELEELELWGNQLMRLSSGIFYGLRKLRRLDLGNNRLTRIPRSVFSSMVHLRELYLQHNLITSIDNAAFNGLSNLQTLKLNENHLTSLSGTPFAPLSALLILDLKENQLQTMQQSVLTSIQNIHNSSASISFHDNPFICNCSLYWMYKLKTISPKTSRISAAIDLVTCRYTDEDGIMAETYYNVSYVPWSNKQCENKKKYVTEDEMILEQKEKEDLESKTKKHSIIQETKPSITTIVSDEALTNPTPVTVQNITSTEIQQTSDTSEDVHKSNSHHQQTEEHFQEEKNLPKTALKPDNNSYPTRTLNFFLLVVAVLPTLVLSSVFFL